MDHVRQVQQEIWGEGQLRQAQQGIERMVGQLRQAQQEIWGEGQLRQAQQEIWGEGQLRQAQQWIEMVVGQLRQAQQEMNVGLQAMVLHAINNFENYAVQMQRATEQAQIEDENIRSKYLSPKVIAKLKKETNKIKTMYGLLTFMNKLGDTFYIKIHLDTFRELFKELNLHDIAEYILDNPSKRVKNFSITGSERREGGYYTTDLTFHKNFFHATIFYNCCTGCYANKMLLTEIFEVIEYRDLDKIKGLFDFLKITSPARYPLSKI